MKICMFLICDSLLIIKANNVKHATYYLYYTACKIKTLCSMQTYLDIKQNKKNVNIVWHTPPEHDFDN